MDTISTYKSRIDGLMNILFGAGVSNPQTIIEQINYLLFLRALSVKDDEAELLGIADEAGKIFTGTLSKYKWSNLLALNAEDLFKTLEESYDEIQKESTNATVKLLFRNAHVKIFDKPTLRRVLHEIEEFSKELDTIAHDGNKDVFGDMYEYLLSKLSAAGTNGQFRTPRHIIDFMVRVLDPKTGETILDPACGTAGFLVAAYRYIAGEYTSEKMKKAGSPRAMDKLSSEEKNFLYNHMFTGFDSDEDMIKFGMMNLHLHGLTKSRLVRQNTLVDTTGFKEKFDVVLANPPFAGKLDEESVSEDIRMNTKATEILFLRFMMDHLSDKGKMAVIVPEGVIFNASRANSKIREMLMYNGLWAVVSLPAGVFNPYAGVKTSILLLDREISKKNSDLLFIKVSNDGFDLGAQRHAHSHDDLPLALEILSEWKKGKKSESAIAVYVEKSKISAASDYNLTVERYRVGTDYSNAKWPMVELGDVLEYEQPTEYIVSSTDYRDEYPTPVLTAGKSFILGYTNEKEGIFHEGLPVIIFDDFTTATKFVDFSFKVKSSAMKILRTKKGVANIRYVYHAMQNITFTPNEHKRFWISEYSKIRIPLPPLEIQQQVVAELDGYAGIIAGAKQVVENWKPQIDINPEWDKVKVEKISTLVRGSSPRPQGDKRYYGGAIPRLMVSDVTRDGMHTTPKTDFLTDAGAKLSRPMKAGEVVMAVSGNPGLPSILSVDACIHDGFVGFRELSPRVLPEYLYYIFLYQKEANNRQSVGAVFKNLTTDQIKQFDIPVPPLEAQRQVIEKIEAERTLVESNKKLIAIYEQKTKDTITKLWSE